MKRDLLFIVEKLVSLIDENRLTMVARQHSIRQNRDEGGIGKTVLAYVRGSDEGTLSRLLVESVILLAASRANTTQVLRDAANTYKVNTEAITLKVKQEFAAKEKVKRERNIADSKPVKGGKRIKKEAA
jgi:ParB family chromosome partitioning protein